MGSVPWRCIGVRHSHSCRSAGRTSQLSILSAAELKKKRLRDTEDGVLDWESDAMVMALAGLERNAVRLTKADYGSRQRGFLVELNLSGETEPRLASC